MNHFQRGVAAEREHELDTFSDAEDDHPEVRPLFCGYYFGVSDCIVIVIWIVICIWIWMAGFCVLCSSQEKRKATELATEAASAALTPAQLHERAAEQHMKVKF